MADAGDEMPPAAAGDDAEQSEVGAAAESAASRLIGKRKLEDQLLESREDELKLLELAIGNLREIAALERRIADECQAQARASREELRKCQLETLTKVHAEANVLGLAVGQLQEKVCEIGELLDARKALIEGFLNHKLIIKESSHIGIKLMGELEEAPFKRACMRKYGNGDDTEAKACTLRSFWEDALKDTSWRPFKTIEVDGKIEEVVDENDDKLAQLKMVYGNDVWGAVKVAVAELRGYSTTGGYPVPELWNFDEGRKVTMVEALNYVFEHLNK